jgi:hypothetical protein
MSMRDARFTRRFVEAMAIAPATLVFGSFCAWGLVVIVRHGVRHGEVGAADVFWLTFCVATLAGSVSLWAAVLSLGSVVWRMPLMLGVPCALYKLLAVLLDPSTWVNTVGPISIWGSLALCVLLALRYLYASLHTDASAEAAP